MTAERFEIAPVTLQYGETPDDLDLVQMENFQISPNVQKSRIRPGGSLDAVAFMTGRAKPQVTFGTRDLVTLLSQMSLTGGMCVNGEAIFRELERDVCNDWTGGGVEYKSVNSGFAYPMSFTASQDDTDGVAMGCTFIPFWDGGTSPPIVGTYIADMAAAGAPAAAFVSQFFMGPVYRNATEVRGVTQSGLDCGLTVTATPLVPGVFDRSAAITDRQAMITYTTSKSNAQLNLFGECDSVSIYLQKGAACSDRVPYATAEHIKISCTVGFVEVTSAGGSAAADAEVQVQISPVGPIAVSLASAIP